MNTKKEASSCDTCAYYAWDEDYECYTCESDMDEDDMARFVSDTMFACPYYRSGDEYKIVRRQI